MNQWVYIGPVKIDGQGRIVIPKRWREQLQLKAGDTLEMKICKVGKASG